MNPTIPQYNKLAQIYAGLSESDAAEKAKEHQDSEFMASVEFGYQAYLQTWLRVPMAHWKEILALGRKLSPLETKALDLKKEATAANENGINITIEGIDSIQ